MDSWELAFVSGCTKEKITHADLTKFDLEVLADNLHELLWEIERALKR